MVLGVSHMTLSNLTLPTENIIHINGGDSNTLTSTHGLPQGWVLGPLIFEVQLFTRCLLLVKTHSLLVTRCENTRYSLKNSPVTCCRSCSLQKVTRYSLQKLLFAKNHSSFVLKFACYSLQKLLLEEIHLLLVAKLSCYSLHKLLAAKFLW